MPISIMGVCPGRRGAGIEIMVSVPQLLVAIETSSLSLRRRGGVRGILELLEYQAMDRAVGRVLLKVGLEVTHTHRAVVVALLPAHAVGEPVEEGVLGHLGQGAG